MDINGIDTLVKKIIQRTRINKLVWEEDDAHPNFLETKFDVNDEFREPISVLLHWFMDSGVKKYQMDIYSKARKLEGCLDSDKYAPLRKFAEEMFVD